MNTDFIYSGFMQTGFWGNTLYSYILSIMFFLVYLGILHFLKNVVIGRLKAMAKKTETDLDDLAVELLAKFRWFEYQLLAFYMAVRHLNRDPLFNKILIFALLIVFTYKAILIIHHLISYWVNKIAAQRNLSVAAKASVANSTRIILNAVVWVAAALFVLDNLGVNISAVLTGLGIGGVAVALAAQAILGDLFNFFVILLDKPFTIGDFVVSNETSGEIEHIGLKSTRIRSISGEIVVVSNSNLLASRIKNFRQMTSRRVTFKTGVVYQTKPECLRRIPALIKEAVTAQKEAEFERTNLSTLGDFSVDFETVYHMTSPDYNLYMASHEKILLAIMDAFTKEGIEFAYPTQTLFVNGGAKSAP